MELATRILIVGGMSLVSFGFLLGIPMLMARSRSPKPPRYLFAAHLVPIIQGGLLMAMSAAMGLADLPAAWAIGAAAALAAGMGLFTLGMAVNWLEGVQDAFAENAVGGKISGIGLPLLFGGMGVLFYGVVAGL